MLKAHEFIRRFLQYILPKGVHKVRYYGLWSPANRKYLYKMKGLLADDADDAPRPEPQQDSSDTKTPQPSNLKRTSEEA